MQKDELAEKLNHLDPGSTTQIDPALLAELFGASSLTQETVEAVQAFAANHRCTFLYEMSARHPPTFEKDDIY